MADNVLCTKKIINDTDTSYYAENGYTGETINLYVVNQTPEYHHTTAFLNIKRGSDWGPPTATGLQGVKNPIKIKLLNVPSFSYLTYGTNYFSWTTSNISDTIGRTTLNYIESGKAYAQVIQDGEGKHGFFDIDGTSHSAILDLSSLQPSVKKNVAAPIPGVWGGHFALWGSETVDGYESNYLFMDRAYTGGALDVFYPTKSFSSYSSSFFIPLKRGCITKPELDRLISSMRRSTSMPKSSTRVQLTLMSLLPASSITSMRITLAQMRNHSYMFMVLRTPTNFRYPISLGLFRYQNSTCQILN